jgi:myo-inositol-1(or 4)-monophosphatase
MNDFPPASHLDQWLLTAREAAEEAAAIHTTWAGRLDVGTANRKGFADFVSEVDLKAQEAALGLIHRHHPDHAVLAEEGDASGNGLPEDATPVWIVDPLDGTANYLHGHPMYAASVGVAISGVVVAGAVTAPALGSRWWARRDAGAFRNGERVRTSGLATLEGAMIGTGFPFKEPDHLETYAAQLSRVLRSGAQVRRGGAAAIDLCYVADGRFEGFWEATLHPWDYAAGALILEEAGGVTGRTDGTPLGLAPGSVAAGASASLFSELLARIGGPAAASRR